MQIQVTLENGKIAACQLIERMGFNHDIAARTCLVEYDGKQFVAVGQRGAWRKWTAVWPPGPMLTGTQGITPIDLQTTIMDVLRSSGQALTFEDVVKCVAQKLEGDVRVTLNELVAKEQILLHVGDRNHRWRYQALPMKRRF